MEKKNNTTAVGLYAFFFLLSGDVAKDYTYIEPHVKLSMGLYGNLTQPDTFNFLEIQRPWSQSVLGKTVPSVLHSQDLWPSFSQYGPSGRHNISLLPELCSSMVNIHRMLLDNTRIIVSVHA